MITGEIKAKVDRIWDPMWSGGISNPLSVIEQLTYLLFIKRLDELHTLKERKAARIGKPVEEPVFAAGQDHLRWSRFKETAPETMFATDFPNRSSSPSGDSPRLSSEPWRRAAMTESASRLSPARIRATRRGWAMKDSPHSRQVSFLSPSMKSHAAWMRARSSPPYAGKSAKNASSS